MEKLWRQAKTIHTYLKSNKVWFIFLPLLIPDMQTGMRAVVKIPLEQIRKAAKFATFLSMYGQNCPCPGSVKRVRAGTVGGGSLPAGILMAQLFSGVAAIAGKSFMCLLFLPYV